MSCARCGEVCSLRFRECQDDPLIQYRNTVAPIPCVSVAEALLDFWRVPYSGRYQRFAYHALRLALAHGLDVLEPDAT